MSGQHLATRLNVREEVAGLFSPRHAAACGPGLVGLELELIAVAGTGDGPPRRVPRARLEALVAATGPMIRQRGNVTFEPGGQLELSPACAPSAHEAVGVALELVRRLRAAADDAGIMLLSCGTDPWTQPDAVGLQLDHPRYHALQAHFDRIGAAGRRMMRCTAALQVCLDLGHGVAAGQRWRLLNLAGPALTATLANSPVSDGVEAGVATQRSLTWQSTDPSRTGFDGAQVEGGEAGYTEMALDAEVIPIPRGSTAGDGVEPAPRTRWREWMDQDCERPDRSDLATHLTTLFPPVRPRGYLEVRYLDALPMELMHTAVTLLVCLAYDDACREQALEALDGGGHATLEGDRRRWPARWEAAARDGLGDLGHRRLAGDLIGLARAASWRFPDGYLPEGAEAGLASLAERVAAGRCPADDRLDAFRRQPHEGATWS